MNRFLAALALLALATAPSGAATQTSTSQPTKTAAAKSATPAKGAKMDDPKNLVADIKTTKGTITIRFFPDQAPNHVQNFLDLSRSGFYNGTKFHRIIPGFMIQGGDPNTKQADQSKWGMGGSGKNIKAEFNSIHHGRGILSMARSNDPNSASSQFFIVVGDAGFLDGKYTVFGQVLTGMDVADAIVSGPASGDKALEPVAIESVTVRAAKAGEIPAAK